MLISCADTAQLICAFVLAYAKCRVSHEATYQIIYYVDDNLIAACPTELGGVTVPKDLCRAPITDKTPISVLLPTMKESGLCTFALLDFLLRRQNDFLDRYMKETKRYSPTLS